MSQPGLGPVLAARVLAEFGDAPNRYDTAKARKNYAGTSPITRESGKSRAVLARHVRNRRLADALYLQAFAALKASPGARAYYDTRRSRGATHHQALRAVGNRLSGSCTAAFATTSSMTKTSPGRSTTAHIKLPLDIFKPWDVLYTFTPPCITNNTQ